MNGEKTRAIQVITVRVYGVEDAFSMVRDQAEFRLEGKTSGYSAANQPVVSAPVAMMEAMKAQPSRPRRVMIRAIPSVATASTPRPTDKAVPRIVACQTTAAATS